MKAAAIIPAYNEETTIGAVIDTVKRVPQVAQVVVVSDGSTDRTVHVAKQKGVRVIDLKTNIGKGGAMKRGIQSTAAGVVLFLDADLVGLTERHVEALIEPVADGQAEMSVGLFEGGRMATDLAQAVAPFLSGQRAVRREILDEIGDMDITRFGIEVALTRHVRAKNYRVENVVLSGLTHRMKEEKLGFARGLMARLRMYWEIVRNVQRG
ncbi:MAG: glycosyltransferase family 2 protein [Bacillota bacterium]|nr:glycosyltransferase family 2 protein [Bacillota bacterium]